MSTQFDKQANRKAAWRWGSFVVGLLSLQVVIGVVAIMLSSGDESVAVVPDYYQKALDWDHTVGLNQASDELGWQLSCETPIAEGESAGLVLQLTDQDGVPIHFATGQLQWYRHARAAHVRSVPIENHPGGMFKLDACFETGGLWQLMVDVTDTAGNRFTRSLVLDIDSPNHAPDPGAS